MNTVFGAIAGRYDELRPGYADSIADTILATIGGIPATVTEIGAGTGKATAVFRRIGAPMTCLEPDERMAAQLAEHFPGVEIVMTSVETWTPPAEGVPLLVGALIWHLLEPQRRCRVVHDALAPGGHVALVGRKNVTIDPVQAAKIQTAFDEHGWAIGSMPLYWIGDDLAESGLFTDIAASRHDTEHTTGGADFVRLVSTYSKFQALGPERQQRLVDALTQAVTETGGVVRERLETTLHIARRN
jgi:SAM-dependent methyltransferase